MNVHTSPAVSPSLVLRAALATDFMAFTEYAFGVVRPNAPFMPNWHLEAIAHKLSQVASGEVRRLIITVPPRSLKSICVSVALPAWYLGHNPSERVLAVSYSDDLAKYHANDFRKLINDPLYQATFPGMRLEKDTDRESRTTKRGRRYATSIEGTLTGIGGDLIIIDDPLKPTDAQSEAVRKRAIEWYQSTAITRPDNKTTARIVVLMQRVHQEDLVGYLLEQGGFEILNLPAVAQEDGLFDLGNGRRYRRRKGEILHPAREPASVLLEIKKNMGPIKYAAQYQQTPVPLSGNIVKRQWLRTFKFVAFEPGDRMIMSWDIALSETETANYSAGVVLLQRGEKFYVLEVLRGRFPFEKLKRSIIDMRNRYAYGALIIEDAPISTGLIQSLGEQQINVVPYKPTTDKVSRLIHQTDLFAGGSIFLREGAPWLEDFVAELLAFPGSRNDDQVDALTQGLAWTRASPPRRITSGRTVGDH